ncbi:unnamed protein product [Symbiodinium microadriaticum]|nr:unnamed protein product [Symbiodinium microadriaticum]CAE7832288.1 unnamed protein product [Symbiodinium sp. KB8]
MRETTVRAVGKSSVLKDAWSQVGHPHRDLGYLWTGQTKFNVKVDKQASAVPVPQDELAETSFQEGFEEYWGDVFPDHWSEAEKARPAKKYVDVPEEFYSKSKRRPDSWSAFPSTTANYGWDLAASSHQAMINQARDEFMPAYLYASPLSTPWTTSSSKKAAHLRKAEQLQETVSMDFAKHLFEKQAKDDLGFCVAQPLNSVMFKDKKSPFRFVGDLCACRKKQQVDQCAHGCADSHGAPVKKSTVLMSNVKVHVTRQGRGDDATPTAHTVVYPQRLCRAVIDDVWKFVRASGHHFATWPSELMLHSFSGYKCERCQLGRAALPWMEHSLIPGECRHGRRPPGEGPRGRLPVDPIATFKRQARDKDLSDGELTTPQDIFFPVQDSLYLKYALFRLIQDSVAFFSEATARGMEYVHWVADPVIKTMFQQILQKEMNVKGIICALRPFPCMVPEESSTIKLKDLVPFPVHG